MTDEKNLETLKLLEGKYSYQRQNKKFRLALYGPNNSKKYDHGDHFSFSREEKNDDGAGISETFFGAYKVDKDKLILDCQEMESESWDENEEAEGEAFIEPCEDGPIEGRIVKEPVIVIVLNFWEDTDLELKWIKLK